MNASHSGLAPLTERTAGLQEVKDIFLSSSFSVSSIDLSPWESMNVDLMYFNWFHPRQVRLSISLLLGLPWTLLKAKTFICPGPKLSPSNLLPFPAPRSHLIFVPLTLLGEEKELRRTQRWDGRWKKIRTGWKKKGWMGKSSSTVPSSGETGLLVLSELLTEWNQGRMSI